MGIKISKFVRKENKKLKAASFTYDDMEVAYEAGRARASWEEGYGRPEEPVFADFMRQNYS